MNIQKGHGSKILQYQSSNFRGNAEGKKQQGEKAPCCMVTLFSVFQQHGEGIVAHAVVTAVTLAAAGRTVTARGGGFFRGARSAFLHHDNAFFSGTGSCCRAGTHALVLENGERIEAEYLHQGR